jgi:hypothetical protein
MCVGFGKEVMQHSKIPSDAAKVIILGAQKGIGDSPIVPSPRSVRSGKILAGCGVSWHI